MVYPFLKRAIDLTLSLFALIVLSPLFLIVMIVLRLTGDKKVFFKQERVGYRNKKINLWKFVTMRTGSELESTITAKSDPRVLPVGKILRKAKINEIPQLINIIKGDISIVGPRPQTQECFDCYPEEIRYQVYDSKPGLTGIGSVIFRMEDEITGNSPKGKKECYREDIMPVKGELELWYTRNKSLYVDFKLILLTAIVIFFPKSKKPYRWLKGIPISEDFIENITKQKEI